MQIPPRDKPGVLETAPRRDASNPRDCVVAFSDTLQERDTNQGMHLLLIGAYESVQQQPEWKCDPVMYYIGAYNGLTFTPEKSVAQGER